MSVCEKCWRDAGGDAVRYLALLGERYDHPCSAEEQAGPDSQYCPHCERRSVHQHTGVCIICDLKIGETKS